MYNEKTEVLKVQEGNVIYKKVPVNLHKFIDKVKVI